MPPVITTLFLCEPAPYVIGQDHLLCYWYEGEEKKEGKFYLAGDGESFQLRITHGGEDFPLPSDVAITTVDLGDSQSSH